MIEFGGYDKKISFISFQEVGDGYGGFIPTPNTILTTFSSIKQVKGFNKLEADQLKLPKTYLFKIQFRNGFFPDETMQILYRDTYHAILGIEETHERNTREWIITSIKI